MSKNFLPTDYYDPNKPQFISENLQPQYSKPNPSNIPICRFYKEIVACAKYILKPEDLIIFANQHRFCGCEVTHEKKTISSHCSDVFTPKTACHDVMSQIANNVLILFNNTNWRPYGEILNNLTGKEDLVYLEKILQKSLEEVSLAIRRQNALEIAKDAYIEKYGKSPTLKILIQEITTVFMKLKSKVEKCSNIPQYSRHGMFS